MNNQEDGPGRYIEFRMGRELDHHIAIRSSVDRENLISLKTASSYYSLPFLHSEPKKSALKLFSLRPV
jgi:hypothetical protein